MSSFEKVLHVSPGPHGVVAQFSDIAAAHNPESIHSWLAQAVLLPAQLLPPYRAQYPKQSFSDLQLVNKQ